MDDFDISREMAFLYRLAAQGEAPPPPRSRAALTWLSAAALTLAIGWGGAAFAARSGYTVSSGETLYQIAKRHFGAGTRWVEIAALNGIKDPAKVQAGQVITLPDPHEHIDTAAYSTASSPSRSRKGSAVRNARGESSSSDRREARRSRFARDRQAVNGRSRDRHATIGRTQDGIRIVPAGEVVLELPARRNDDRTAALSRARSVAAERVRPQQNVEDVAPLPTPTLPVPLSDSPWRAVDGAAFLLGALGLTGLLARGRSAARVACPT